MGCKHSSTIKVQPVGSTLAKQDNINAKVGKEGSTQTPTLGRKNLSRESTVDEYELDSDGNKVKRKKNRKSNSRNASRKHFGSSDSLGDDRSLDGDRGFSATSKASTDSGLGVDDYGRIITEYSKDEDVRRVEESFIEKDLDLGITGTQLSTRFSAKDRARQEESSILQALREEGLISKQTAQSSGGMSFEIVTKDSKEGVKLPLPPPVHLEKLERRRKKKKTLTEDEIREKLERAERRRKVRRQFYTQSNMRDVFSQKREEERLSKIKEMERTDALSALENFELYKKEKEVQQTQKMDVVTINRDKKLQQVREKVKERERRAEEVRKRKQMALIKGLENNGIINNEAEYPTGMDNPAFSEN